MKEAMETMGRVLRIAKEGISRYDFSEPSYEFQLIANLIENLMKDLSKEE